MNSYDNVKDLKKASEIVVEAEVTNDQKSFDYEGLTFTSTKINVLKVYKVDVKKDQALNILELGGSTNGIEVNQDGVSIIKPSEHYILFLYKYEGPVVNEPSYQVRGCYQGKLKIENDKIKQVAPDAAKLKDINKNEEKDKIDKLL